MELMRWQARDQRTHNKSFKDFSIEKEKKKKVLKNALTPRDVNWCLPEHTLGLRGTAGRGAWVTFEHIYTSYFKPQAPLIAASTHKIKNLR